MKKHSRPHRVTESILIEQLTSWIASHKQPGTRGPQPMLLFGLVGVTHGVLGQRCFLGWLG
jgi:hypothetical protein